MILETDGSQESLWVLKLSHLQVKQSEMCHSGVSGSICIDLVHPKILTKNLYVLRLPTFSNSESLREISTAHYLWLPKGLLMSESWFFICMRGNSYYEISIVLEIS